MKRVPAILFLAVLLIGLLPCSGDARGIGCFGRGGFACHCCTSNGTLETTESFSPCPCPGPEQSPSMAQDLFMTLTVIEFDLEATGFVDFPNPVTRIFFGSTPQKPPPFLV